MSLLVTPQRLPDEGPMGYRFRLASANLLSVRSLVALLPHEEGESCAFADAELIDDRSIDGGGIDEASPDLAAMRQGRNCGSSSSWIVRWARFCPRCLGAREAWHAGWEVLFADACALCGNWLVDTCGKCAQRISWRRLELQGCDCGELLACQPTSAAPEAVAKLSRALASAAMGRDILEPAVVQGLTLAQLLRLVRLLGAYGTSEGQRTPQKVLAIDRLEISWPIVCVAAEVLCTWPQGFSMLLDRLKTFSRERGSRKFVGVFGGFYAALYAGFSHPAFDFLRRAFENYVAANWTGAFARRNTRLATSVMDSMSWIPANRAQDMLGVSRTRLNALVAEGKLKGELRLSAKGRKFLVVNKTDVAAIQPMVRDVVPLGDAARKLGLKAGRLLAMLPLLCPEARQQAARGSRWDIPLAWIERWTRLLAAAAPLSDPTRDMVTLRQVLRYWPWTNGQLARFLVDVQSDRLLPIGRSANPDDLGGLLFMKEMLRAWFAATFRATQGEETEMTVPQAAAWLDVKQEVAYALVRAGLLETTARQTGRRRQRCVSVDSLMRFHGLYVFARDVARQLGCSPKAAATRLAERGMSPMAGPALNGCRQLLFERAGVMAHVASLQPSSSRSPSPSSSPRPLLQRRSLHPPTEMPIAEISPQPTLHRHVGS